MPVADPGGAVHRAVHPHCPEHGDECDRTPRPSQGQPRIRAGSAQGEGRGGASGGSNGGDGLPPRSRFSSSLTVRRLPLLSPLASLAQHRDAPRRGRWSPVVGPERDQSHHPAGVKSDGKKGWLIGPPKPKRSRRITSSRRACSAFSASTAERSSAGPFVSPATHGNGYSSTGVTDTVRSPPDYHRRADPPEHERRSEYAGRRGGVSRAPGSEEPRPRWAAMQQQYGWPACSPARVPVVGSAHPQGSPSARGR
jgi:hypothetical protein